MEASDTELIRAYTAGDERAFEELYYRYRRQLYGYLNNLIQSNSGEVDEVFEETWLRVIDRLSKYRDDGKFSAWLFRIARNIFIDRVRRSKPGLFRTIDDEEAPQVPAPASMEARAGLENSELGKVIQRALGALPVEQKEVFLLRQQDLSFKEIAEIQQCSLNTALSRMRYALNTLREFIRNIDQGGLLK